MPKCVSAGRRGAGLTGRGIVIPMRANRFHPGLTIIELLVTTAITAILASIFFVGLSNEKSRNAVKIAADQLQGDLQDMQNRNQSGVIAPGGIAPPAGYGFEAETGANNNRYVLFADLASGSPPSNDSYWDGGTIDRQVLTRSLPGNIQVNGLSTNVGAAARLDMVFSGFRGEASIRPDVGCPGGNPTCATSATIILKHTRLNACYAITVNQAAGLVTKKQFTSGAGCP